MVKDNAVAVANQRYELKAEQFDASGAGIFNTKQLELLHTPTPDAHIHHLPANAGKKSGLPYVTGGYIKHKLTQLFGGAWSFEVKEKGIVEGEIWILGRLIVPGANGQQVVREQFGGATIKKLKDGNGNVNLANDMKAATTDALKKCASELGIAGDVYNANEFIDAKIIDEVGEDIEGTDAPDDTQTIQDDQPNKERQDPATLVTADYKHETERMLNAAHPGSADRVKFIKTVTEKMSTATLSQTHWVWLREALEAEAKGEVIK